MSQPRLRIEPLGKHHDRTGFTCGEDALDRYFHRQARQDLDRLVAAVFVLVDAETKAVAGYYTLSAGSVRPSDLPPDIAKKLPRYPALPVVLLGRLAVDVRYWSRGLGESLLFNALRRALDQSVEIAAMAVVVDAKDDRARSFYERYGFLRFADDEYRLFVPMRLIEHLAREEA